MTTIGNGLLLTFFGYLFGSIPSALIIGKLKTGKDIRDNEYQNMGANNVYHSIGKIWGIFTFVCDFLKGYIPTSIGYFLYINELLHGGWFLGIAGSTICGHNWPIFAGFRGGKGASTAAGVSFAIFPLISLLLVPLLVLMNTITKNISFAAGFCFLLVPLFVFSKNHGIYEGYASILIPLLILPKIVPLFIKMIRTSKLNPKKMWYIIVYGFKRAAEYSAKKSSIFSTKIKNSSKGIITKSTSLKNSFFSVQKKKSDRKKGQDDCKK
jgi:acyl phosphate:glycerol-3-phosphate acyltransferase